MRGHKNIGSTGESLANSRRHVIVHPIGSVMFNNVVGRIVSQVSELVGWRFPYIEWGDKIETRECVLLPECWPHCPVFCHRTSSTNNKEKKGWKSSGGGARSQRSILRLLAKAISKRNNISHLF